MMHVQDYLQAARENEEVFRNILRDLRDNREERAMGHLVPEELETDLPLEELFGMHSSGNRYGIFTVCDFERPEPNAASLTFENVACMSGGGAELKYAVAEDDSVEYQGHGMVFMS